jgi:hypothetical protein
MGDLTEILMNIDHVAHGKLLTSRRNAAVGDIGQNPQYFK